MQSMIKALIHNDLFILFFNVAIAQVAFSAVLIATLQVPPDSILDTDLKEIILIFED